MFSICIRTYTYFSLFKFMLNTCRMRHWTRWLTNSCMSSNYQVIFNNPAFGFIIFRYIKEVNDSTVFNNKGNIKNKQKFLNELQILHSKNSPLVRPNKMVITLCHNYLSFLYLHKIKYYIIAKETLNKNGFLIEPKKLAEASYFNIIWTETPSDKEDFAVLSFD